LIYDEPELKARFGFEYVIIESKFSVLFPDAFYITIHRDFDKTCQPIAKFSQHDTLLPNLPLLFKEGYLMPELKLHTSVSLWV